MTDQEIDWNDVESAEAQEDGLHIKRKDGTLGVLSIKPVGANLQRQAWCRKIAEALNHQSQALHQLLETKAAAPASAQAQLDAAIAACKANIKQLQDLIRSTGCG